MMSNPVLDCLSDRSDNYILPFLWLHGEEEAILRNYVQAINSAGVKAVCLESRPHPDFLGERWWHDLDIILDEARNRGMKVWILDDKHFPTGQAGGAMEKAPLKLQKQYLGCNMADVCGPQRRVRIHVAQMARTPINPLAPSRAIYDDDQLFAVVASRLDGDICREPDHVDGEIIDLTAQTQEGELFWDVPPGLWRLFVFYKTHNGGSEHYINLIDAASCKVLLDTVYEPHYAHYAADFGKTIAGFFSDEPGLGNVSGNSFNNIIGKRRMNLPWSRELEELLGSDFTAKLPALWCEYGTKEETAAIRCRYMDLVTGLVSTCFSEQIGRWCRNHGVEYIGHIIEDNNASEGLGSSIGHYFRSLWGQDMAGIDDIGAQLTMGGQNTEHLSFAGSGDGEFYHHVLGKLGSSLAHIDPKKRDRCVCECFGAYGWSEGTQLMKYIADHLLADGVNYFVPHAFSAKPFPDMDCPPHFYVGGEDVLFPAFGRLMGYLNRVSHVLSNYKHTVSVAILYHAEAAWSGGRLMKLQKAARVLRENQIDFDILPSEVLRLTDGRLTVNRRFYDALVVPGCDYLPERTACFCEEAKAQGFPVLFAGFAPDSVEATPVSLEDLPDMLLDKASIQLNPKHPDIRCYHGGNGREDVYFLFNSSTWAAFDGEVKTGNVQNCYRYDAMDNRLYRHHSKNGSIRIKLAPCESALFLLSEENLQAYEEPKEPVHTIPLKANWRISYQSGEGFVPYMETNALDGFEKPGYSGTIRYECTVMEDIAPERILLELPQVRETAAVWCNGQFAGNAIAAPFAFDLTQGWQKGENHLRIDVVTTMEQKVLAASGGRDLFTLLQKVWPAYGLVGTPALRYL